MKLICTGKQVARGADVRKALQIPQGYNRPVMETGVEKKQPWLRKSVGITPKNSSSRPTGYKTRSSRGRLCQAEVGLALGQWLRRKWTKVGQIRGTSHRHPLGRRTSPHSPARRLRLRKHLLSLRQVPCLPLRVQERVVGHLIHQPLASACANTSSAFARFPAFRKHPSALYDTHSASPSPAPGKDSSAFARFPAFP